MNESEVKIIKDIIEKHFFDQGGTRSNWTLNAALEIEALLKGEKGTNA